MLFGQVSQEVAQQLKEKEKERAARHEGEARKQYRLAADTLRHYLARDAYDPQLRFQLAAALYLAGDSAAGKRQAEAARDLDATLSPDAGHRLSDRQRTQLAEWLGGPPTP
jgi:hypothetical protein